MATLNLQALDERELMPGFRGRFVHTDSMTFAFCFLVRFFGVS